MAIRALNAIRNCTYYFINVWTNLLGGRSVHIYVPQGRHPLNELYRLVQKINVDPSLQPQKQNLIHSELRKVDKDIRFRLYEKIYMSSNDPAKGGPRWGEEHASDNLETLLYSIYDTAKSRLNELDPQQRNQVYQSIYEIAQCPATLDPRWGENNALGDTERLIMALNRNGHLISRGSQLSYPSRILNYEASQVCKPTLYDLQRRELPRGRIGYINGINTYFDQAKGDAAKISDNCAQGYNFYNVYVAANGRKTDLFRIIMGHSGIATQGVKLLHEQWANFFDKSDPDEKFLQICHSAGSIDVFNALKDLPQEMQKRIIVLAAAPAYIIPKELCHKVYNYIIPSDHVPYWAPNRHLIDSGSPEVVVLAEQPQNSHDPHGDSYRREMQHHIDTFIRTNDIL